ASKSITCWSRRLAMISQYFSSSSTPMDLRPRLRAATKVEPDPANGSATVPFVQEINCSRIDTGFECGCAVLYRATPPLDSSTDDLSGGLLGCVPSRKISSVSVRYPVVEPTTPESIGLRQTSVCLTPSGNAARNEPKTMQGRPSPHAAIATSRAVVSWSFWMPRCLADFAALFSPLLHPIPYGGSVTRTSASSHSRCSPRQSP